MEKENSIVQKYEVTDWQGNPVTNGKGEVLSYSYEDALKEAMRLGVQNLKPYLVNRARKPS